MIYKLIAPSWLLEDSPSTRKVVEDVLAFESVRSYNEQGYNCYFYPNTPLNEKSTISMCKSENRYINGTDINKFNYVFVDMDLKDGSWKSKEKFIDFVQNNGLSPTSIVDSGNGVHVYWKVTGLEALDFLRLQRRLCRFYNTDEAVSKLNQVLRVPGTLNTKDPNNKKLCKIVFSSKNTYEAEELDKTYPVITSEDEEYAQRHYDMTFNPDQMPSNINDELPEKFKKLTQESEVVRQLFYGQNDDRSAADFRLANLLKNSAFTKEEALSVLLNVQKAVERNSYHRYNYANNIVQKIWIETVEKKKTLSKSVSEIMGQSENLQSAPRVYGHTLFDATVKGFRLGQVWGVIGGSGVGKSSVALNQFKWFAQYNPDHIHLFVSLEMTRTEIADRWEKMCQGNKEFYDKVYIIDNHDDEGNFLDIGLTEIETEVKLLEQITGRKVGCVVVDHIGVLRQENTSSGEYSGLQGLCKYMKSFATTLNVFLIMLSQTSREKAGIGDVELDKDAAWGTSKFENYCNFVTTIWQPLKRVYKQMPNENKLAVLAYKFCKIREKDIKKDRIQEDAVYAVYFDSDTENMRPLTSEEFEAYKFWNKLATDERAKDRKAQPSELTMTSWVEVDSSSGKITSH